MPYPFQYMPDVAGGLAFEYNLQGANGQRIKNLILNGPTLEGIFTGSIRNWNNPAIQALNPSTPLPNQTITAYYRSDPSGENYLFSDYLLHVDPGPLTAFQQEAGVSPSGSPSATWASFSNGTPSNLNTLDPASGADAVSQGPAQTPGAISYVETAYAQNVGLPVASVVNAAGDAVQPSSYNVAEALTAAILYSDLTQNLAGVYTNPNPATYPLSAYSYFVAQCVPSAAQAQNFARCDSGGAVTMGTTQGAEMAQFITYVACAGQSRMASLGYSPIPPNLVEDDFQAAGRLPGGTEPPPPTAQNCANPYITGALQPVGGPTQVAAPPPGGSDDTAAAAAVAAAGAANAAAAASAAKGATTTGTAAGAAGSAASAGAGAAAGASPAAVAAAAAKAKKALDPLTNPVLAYPRQTALADAADHALSGSSPVQIALWSSLFAVFLIGVPSVIWRLQRRRRSGFDQEIAQGGPP